MNHLNVVKNSGFRILGSTELEAVVGGQSSANLNIDIDVNALINTLRGEQLAANAAENEFNQQVDDLITAHGAIPQGVNQFNPDVELFKVGNVIVGDKDNDGRYDFIYDINGGLNRYVGLNGEVYYPDNQGFSGVGGMPWWLPLGVLPWDSGDGSTGGPGSIYDGAGLIP